jgi:hypothetical protein
MYVLLLYVWYKVFLRKYEYANLYYTLSTIKEKPRRRIMVTSSLTEKSTDQLGNGGGEGGSLTPPTPLSTSRLFNKYLKTT